MNCKEARDRSVGCKGCTYAKRYAYEAYFCEYYLQTGKRRPCPPGKDCTVKVSVRSKAGRPPIVNHAAVLEMREAGKRVKEIAAFFGVTTGRIYTIIAAETRKRSMRDEQGSNHRALYARS